MKTLIEYITFTKGVEYLLAIAFLFTFLVFWQLTQGDGKRKLLKVMPVMALALGIGTLALILATQERVTTATPQVRDEPLLNSPVLVEMYGPASFNHELHQRLADDCAVCHHYSQDTYPSCRECHAAPFNPENLNKPGIAHVYHLRCISCHIENQTGPVECMGCHDKAAVPPLSITHPLTGNGNCLSCHQNGITGVPALPTDHDSVTNGVCPICHQTVREESAMATRKLPHAISGYEDCLICHGEGIGGATRVPGDHIGRTDQTCQVCHQTDVVKIETGSPATVSDPTQAQSVEPTTPAGLASPPETEAEPVVSMTTNEEEKPIPVMPSGAVSQIPHAIIGHEACLVCHEEDRGDIVGVPDDHVGRTDQTCQMCHQPAE